MTTETLPEGVTVTIIGAEHPVTIPTGPNIKWGVVELVPPPMTIQGSGGGKGDKKEHDAAPYRKVVVGWDSTKWRPSQPGDGVCIWKGGEQSVWLAPI